MKKLAIILSVGLFGSVSLADPVATAPTTAPSPATPTPAAPSATGDLINAISKAPDPSSTIDAYVRAIAVQPGNLDLTRAYVHHMVELGTPELADAQAHDLVKANAADPLTRGVAAYTDASRGQSAAAISNLKLAMSQAPDDPFLLRTAGQIVAWYDTQLDRSSLSKSDVEAIESMRAQANGKPEYADAYRVAADARRHAPADSSAAPATQPATEAAAAPPIDVSPPTPYYSEAAPSYGGGYGYYYPYYAYPYAGYSYWPTSSILIIRDCDFHHGHNYYHDGYHGGNRGRFHEGANHFDAVDRGDRADRAGGLIARPDGSFGRSRPFVGPLPSAADAAASENSGNGRRRFVGPLPSNDRRDGSAAGRVDASRDDANTSRAASAADTARSTRDASKPAAPSPSKSPSPSPSADGRSPARAASPSPSASPAPSRSSPSPSPSAHSDGKSSSGSSGSPHGGNSSGGSRSGGSHSSSGGSSSGGSSGSGGGSSGGGHGGGGHR